MYQDRIEPSASARDAVVENLQQALAGLAAGLDVRFVHAASTLATVIDTVNRVIASLDSIIHAIDEQTGKAAVRILRESARELTALPMLQHERVNDLGVVRRAAAELNLHVMQIQEVLRILRVNGTNLKIAASGAPSVTRFADEMFARFDAGDGHLKGFMTTLQELVGGVATVQRSARLIAAECAKVIPLVPDRLADDALELQAHQVSIADSAAGVRSIAREVQGRVAVILGALQIGDISRQRLEHMVAALQLLNARRLEAEQTAAARALESHILALIEAQLADVAADLDRETGLLVNALGELGPHTGELVSLIDESDAGREGHAFLHRLERGFTDIDVLTEQLRAGTSKTLTMTAVVIDTMNDLTTRLDAVRLVRADVQDIAVRARLHGERLGTAGRSVAIVAEEIGSCADRLDQAVNGVGWAIRELGAVSVSIRHRHETALETDPGPKLAWSLALIREACRRTDQGIGEGGIDARELIQTLDDAGSRLADELELAATISGFVRTLRELGGQVAEIEGTDQAPLRTILQEIEAMYTMAREREVHRAFLLPGMELMAATQSDTLDDGLF
ncbi:hypothetical protein IAG41_09425 [Sphingomonas sp. JC676]|uniref:hypothetical protein n=1 Tax=Sphingomonas sp. JC676 TaxID=2768065 RepID=UPI00165793CD|nr:hypothetical protein [Sphingomonas sp. JC676]MBC9032611.1 hypothetical protein [Sphingomonas sp. JC676]